MSLRAQVAQIAVVLRREADGIEADPHLNPLIRKADAEVRRTAASRIDAALIDESAQGVPTVRDGIEQALRTLRRLGDAAVPSRAARVRAALDESARLIREAYDGNGEQTAIAAQQPKAAPELAAAMAETRQTRERLTAEADRLDTEAAKDDGTREGTRDGISRLLLERRAEWCRSQAATLREIGGIR
jgi:hypothetical protein